MAIGTFLSFTDYTFLISTHFAGFAYLPDAGALPWRARSYLLQQSLLLLLELLFGDDPVVS
jgi:hypothetical protein